MHNDLLDSLTDYPFDRLRALLGDTPPPEGCTPIHMQIGEPKHPPPDFIGPILTRDMAEWGRYPPPNGPDDLRAAIADWLTARYDLAPLGLGPGFLQAAVDYPWPGNVRQLENFAERLLLTGTPCFSKRDFHEGICPYGAGPRSSGSSASSATSELLVTASCSVATSAADTFRPGTLASRLASVRASSWSSRAVFSGCRSLVDRLR